MITGLFVIYLELADRQFAIFYMRLVKPFWRNLYQNIRLSNEMEVKTIISDFDGI